MHGDFSVAGPPTPLSYSGQQQLHDIVDYDANDFHRPAVAYYSGDSSADDEVGELKQTVVWLTYPCRL